ncbi:hypothetical protein [Streptomyces sp. NPDC005573]|uniref:hypothetical protein n=1 Tax=Streptomyces sp. NPDC005573 TaxID=3156890 RepID=UPI0033AED275
MSVGIFMTLAGLSPIVTIIWVGTAGVFCIHIGRKARSARLGWFLFILLGLMPMGAMFALIGAIVPAVVVAVTACLIIFLAVLERYGLRLESASDQNISPRQPNRSK